MGLFPKDFTKCNKKSLCELKAQVRIFEVHTHDSFLCRPVTKGAAKASRAKKNIILGDTWLSVTRLQLPAGNSDNQLSLNLSPNIRILFVQEV